MGCILCVNFHNLDEDIWLWWYIRFARIILVPLTDRDRGTNVKILKLKLIFHFRNCISPSDRSHEKLLIVPSLWSHSWLWQRLQNVYLCIFVLVILSDIVCKLHHYVSLSTKSSKIPDVAGEKPNIWHSSSVSVIHNYNK